MIEGWVDSKQSPVSFLHPAVALIPSLILGKEVKIDQQIAYTVVPRFWNISFDEHFGLRML